MRESAALQAQKLDAKIEADARAIRLASFKEVLASIRVYLADQNLERHEANNIHQIVKQKMSDPVGLITLGPEFDNGPTEMHYRFKSGARLSFGITLREANGRCSLVAYRFHLHVGGDAGPTFYRFDLNRSTHETPLLEPRSHIHPGRDDIRLPCPALEPLEILDRIFDVIMLAEQES
jgi:hypothetical protein